LAQIVKVKYKECPACRMQVIEGEVVCPHCLYDFAVAQPTPNDMRPEHGLARRAAVVLLAAGVGVGTVTIFCYRTRFEGLAEFGRMARGYEVAILLLLAIFGAMASHPRRYWLFSKRFLAGEPPEFEGAAVAAGAIAAVLYGLVFLAACHLAPEPVIRDGPGISADRFRYHTGQVAGVLLALGFMFTSLTARILNTWLYRPPAE
jgi:hypothetical protein